LRTEGLINHLSSGGYRVQKTLFHEKGSYKEGRNMGRACKKLWKELGEKSEGGKKKTKKIGVWFQ